jgi:hypothetical protein
MQCIIRRSVLAATLAILVVAAACSGENPAGTTLSPATARMDGGATFGSGARTTPGTTENTKTTTAADSGSTVTRGGATLGSGS